MKCFIHFHDEAVAVCKICGKAMCGNCSAYSNHSGICPECRRNEFIREHNSLNTMLNNNKNATIGSIVLTVVFVLLAVILSITIHFIMLVLLIGAIVFFVRIFSLISRRKPIIMRMNYLAAEINKLNAALQRSMAII